MVARDPVADLRRIAFLLERANEATYRVTRVPVGGRGAGRAAGRGAGRAGRGRHADRAARASATSPPGAWPSRWPARSRSTCAGCVATEGTDLDEAAAALRAALRGDCHTHSDWSDGGSPIEEMALAAVELGHEYLVLTDHSPRLTVARGLTADRLRRAARRTWRALNAAAAGGVPHPHRHRGGHPRRRLAGPGRGAAGPARRGGRLGPQRPAGRPGADDPADADRDRQPAPGHPRPLHRPEGRRLGRLGRDRRAATGRTAPAGPGRRATSTRPRSSPPAPSTTRPSRSTAGRTGWTRRSGCSGWR